MAPPDASFPERRFVPAVAYLETLNPEQRRAVEHGVGPKGAAGAPLLVIAGAGSGKTNTLAHRVAHLVACGADPRRILLLTFSRRAAAEMTRRAERIAIKALGPKAGLADSLPWAGTFHAIGARLIRRYAETIGLDQQFTILDREDAADLMNLVRHEAGLSKAPKRFPTKGTCLAIYSRAVNAETSVEQALAAAFPWCAGWTAELKALFQAYVEAKQRQNVLDYDDLLLYWAQMAAEPAIAAEMGALFDHVMVDEYQDTNRLQASILTGLKPDGRGLAVVGDDAQSIYSFRAAEVRNILDFPKAFSPPAEIVTLDRNYRSTAPILDAANAVISLAKERFTKNLRSERGDGALPRLVSIRDEAEQARYVADSVLENREAGATLKSQAVLFRTSHHSAALELELVRRDIPFVKFGGLKFLDAAHVKDLLSILRFAQNPRDRVAGFRAAQLLPGVGPGSASKILDAVVASPAPLETLLAQPAPPRAGADWTGFVATVAAIAHGQGGWPAEIGLARRWYEPHLERIHDDAAVRALDLVQLEQIAASYPSRERFLTEVTLDPPDATSDEAGPPSRDEDYLILSTIHSAKGQEWRSVFVLNGVDGCMPSDLGAGASAELEEERRLLYVAMTRAKDDLRILLPQRFFTHQQRAHGDRHVYAARTRFITKGMLDRFEQSSWPPPSAENEAARGPLPRVDIGARMRAMFR
jgi:DNA helicase-2/ATP-dependent DNA helicase PcrA